MRLILESAGRGNFHNSDPIRIIVDEATIQEDGNGRSVRVSLGQVKRIQTHFCGVEDCTCGSGPKIWDDRLFF